MEDSSAASSDSGIVVFSLDFELHWGVHDLVSVSAWRNRLLGARRAIPRLLELMQEYEIEATWATVGMLFARDRKEMEALRPTVRPTYRNSALSPYDVSVGADEEDDPFHFAPGLIRQIDDAPDQEIATHTFSHYYCLEEGQRKSEFEADLRSAIEAGQTLGVRPESIVFPRNQVNERYFEVLAQNGITSYRGTARPWPYVADPYEEMNTTGRRIGRLADTYVPVFGRTSFTREDVRAGQEEGLYNIPASIFIRSYSPSKKAIESLRRWRVESEIRYAAKQKKIVHLWTHPHNFGEHMDRNLSFLEDIFRTVDECRKRYGAVSASMESLLEKYL